MGPVHELVPVYVPVMVGIETVALPVAELVQVANGASNPPAAIVIEKLIDDPETVPVIDPCPLTPVSVSRMVSVPENALLVCVRRHVIWPGPDESAAGPCQVPLTSTGGAAGTVG